MRCDDRPQRVLERDAQLLVGHDRAKLAGGGLGGVVDDDGQRTDEAVPARIAEAITWRLSGNCSRTPSRCFRTFDATTDRGTISTASPSRPTNA